MCPFDYTAVAGSGKVGPVNQVNHTSWVAVVTPTDCLQSVHNRCVIERVVFAVTLPVGVGAFVIGLSHISSLFFCFKTRSVSANASERLSWSNIPLPSNRLREDMNNSGIYIYMG